MVSTSVTEDAPVNRFSKIFDAEVRKQIATTGKMTLPLIIVNLTQEFMAPIASAFCGHIGTDELAAASLANSVNLLVMLTMGNGLASACDTLMSQIYGSSNKKLLGVVLQRNLVMMLLTSLFSISLYLNMDHILLAIGQDPIVSWMATDYLICMIPAVLGFAVSVSLRKYLANQSILYPVMVIDLVCIVINIFCHWLLLVHYDYGYIASAWSQTISYICVAVFLFIYIIISRKYEETWDGWTWDLFQEWGVFLKLGFGVLCMKVIERISFVLCIVLSGLLGTATLDAQLIMMQLDIFIYSIPLSVGMATSIKVGNFLGSAEPYKSKRAIKVGYLMGLSAAMIILILMIGLRNYIPYIFTNDEAVHELVSKLLILLCCYCLFDAMMCISISVLQGTGRVWVGTIILLCCQGCAFAIGMPISLWKRDIVYLWIMITIAIIAAVIIVFTFIYRFDWDELVREALERTKVFPQETVPENESQESNLLYSELNTNEPTYLRKCSSYDACQPPENDDFLPRAMANSHDLTSCQLILRRGSVIVFFLLMLLTSLLLRFYYPIHHNTITNSTEAPAQYATERITTNI